MIPDADKIFSVQKHTETQFFRTVSDDADACVGDEKFHTEKSLFRTEKSLFRTEKINFSVRKIHFFRTEQQTFIMCRTFTVCPNVSEEKLHLLSISIGNFSFYVLHNNWFTTITLHVNNLQKHKHILLFVKRANNCARYRKLLVGSRIAYLFVLIPEHY